MWRANADGLEETVDSQAFWQEKALNRHREKSRLARSRECWKRNPVRESSLQETLNAERFHARGQGGRWDAEAASGSILSCNLSAANGQGALDVGSFE